MITVKDLSCLIYIEIVIKVKQVELDATASTGMPLPRWYFDAKSKMPTLCYNCIINVELCKILIAVI